MERRWNERFATSSEQRINYSMDSVLTIRAVLQLYAECGQKLNIQWTEISYIMNNVLIFSVEEGR